MPGEGLCEARNLAHGGQLDPPRTGGGRQYAFPPNFPTYVLDVTWYRHRSARPQRTSTKDRRHTLPPYDSEHVESKDILPYNPSSEGNKGS